MASQKLLNSRKARKGWVTKKADILTNLLASPKLDYYALGDAVDEFDSEIAKLDTLQFEIEAEIDDVHARVASACAN